MSDDIWRRRSRGNDDTGEFGGPLFPDEPAEDAADPSGSERRLSFGPNDTGPLPHWTDPPTGEIPRLDPHPSRGDEDDDVDVWSSFTTETPVWKDDEPVPADPSVGPSGDPSGGFARDGGGGYRDPSGGFPRDASGGYRDPSGGYRDPSGGYRDPSGGYRDPGGGFDDPGAFRDPSGSFRDPSAGFDRDPSGGMGRGGYDPDTTGQLRADEISEPMGRPRTGEYPSVAPRQPGRITIGTGSDPSAEMRRGGPPPRRRGGSPRSGRPAGPARTAASAPASTRNMSTAIAAGAILAALFVLATMWRPLAVLILIVAVLGVAGFEYFGKVTEKGYRPAVAPGLAAVVAAPLAAYWVGDFALPLVIAFGFIAAAAGFLGATSVESGPLPNMAVTTLGVVWIGLLGSFAALILRWSNFGPDGNPFGTDTLFLIVLGVALNDIGALAVGSTIGKTPLRDWISPAKTIEGLLGGAVLTLIGMLVFGLIDRSTTWTETSDLLILGLVICVMAPLGDLTESMFKRNLDVKDFGTVMSGHGGVLDRFDGFLFTLPVAYYVTMLLHDLNVV